MDEWYPYYDSTPTFSVKMCDDGVCGIYGPAGELYTKTDWGDKIDLEEYYPWLAINYLVRGSYTMEGTDDAECDTTEIW